MSAKLPSAAWSRGGRHDLIPSPPHSYPQIMREHEAITSVVGKAYRTALDHGIKCGELLTLAQETVTKAKVGWQTWLTDNLPFPQTTAAST